MFSNDKNIESIAQLAELFKHYIGLQTQYIKLDIIEKIVRLFTVITLALVLALTIVLVLIFLSFSAAYMLAPVFGKAGAFLLVAAFYITLFVILVCFRKQLIERPLVGFLASLLMEK